MHDAYKSGVIQMNVSHPPNTDHDWNYDCVWQIKVPKPVFGKDLDYDVFLTILQVPDEGTEKMFAYYFYKLNPHYMCKKQFTLTTKNLHFD